MSRKSIVQEPAFETDHLRVWEIMGVPSERYEHTPRRMFIACLKDEDWPGVVASMSVWPLNSNYVDWIEVIANERRKGYATELVRGCEKWLGEELRVDPVDSMCSVCFCDSVSERKTNVPR